MAGENGKIKVDMADLTLAELDELSEKLDRPIGDVAVGKGNFKVMAATAWMLQRRTDPTFTFEQAMQLKMSDLELAQGEADAAEPGGEPPTSPASGDSTLQTS